MFCERLLTHGFEGEVHRAGHVVEEWPRSNGGACKDELVAYIFL